jgi:glycosyltransferase involved in cell wall biosynthesis
MTLRIKRAVFRLVREALLRYVRAAPRPEDRVGAERRVFILITTAWGMGGTIRANHNLAGYLAAHGYEVEMISVGRHRDVPFFGEFPPGVRVVALEDRRRGARVRLLQRLLRTRSSVFMHPADRTAQGSNLWTDVRLVRRLRRRCGFLIATRPGLNLIAAELSPPGLILIGQEQMHLDHHVDDLRRAMPRLYPRLDALAVLTERDGQSYAAHLNGGVRTVRIPNTVREDMGAGRADLSARTALAAGRLSPQKGYDMLIPAWAAVAAKHPDWRLRICGDGKERGKLEVLIREHHVGDSVSLEGPARDLGTDMEQASMFVLSSRHEGLPLVLLEAMSKGMAVVSFDCPTGPADVIEDHRNGLLVPPRDVDALAAAIIEMIEDDELRERCAAGAAETARDYRMAAVGPRWEALMRELWEARASSSSHSGPTAPMS